MSSNSGSMSEITTILAAKSALLGRGNIGRNCSPEKYVIFKGELDRNIDQIAAIGTGLLKGENPECAMDTLIKAQVKGAQEEIFRSFITRDLLEESNSEYFEYGLGHETMITNLEKIIKMPTAEELETKAIEDFDQMTRRVHLNESFEDFFKRLNTQVAKFCTAKEYADKLVTKQFKKSLREMDRNFLLVVGATSEKTGVEKVKEEAKQLDSKEMHKMSDKSLHSIATNDRLESAMAELANTVNSVVLMSERRNERFTAELSEIRESQTRSDNEMDARLREIERNISALSRPHVESRVQRPIVRDAPKTESELPRGDSNNVQQNVSFRRQNKQKTPCYNCGLLWHKTEDCKGDCKIKCFLCGMVGHTSSARKFHGPEAEAAKYEKN